MKSLEIVNGKIGSIRNSPFEVSFIGIDLSELQQIKQDLEVLKIIRNKRVDLNYLIQYLEYSNNDKIALSRYNGQDRFKLSMEELLKLKQW